MTRKKTHKLITKIFERIYLVILGLYMFGFMEPYMMLKLGLPAWYEPTLLYLAILITLTRLVWHHRPGWDLLGAAALAGAFFMSYWSTGYLFLAFIGVLIVGARDIPYRDVLKVQLVVVGTCVLVSALMMMSGAVEVLVYTNKGFMQLRGCAGMCYPTDAASLVLYLVLVMWCLWPNMPNIAMLLIAFVGYLLSAKYYVSDTSAICFIVLMLAVLWRMVEQHVIEKHQRLQWTRHIVNVGCACAFPILATGMLWIVLAYGQGNELAVRMNDWMSYRVDYAWRALSDYGLSLWGTPFEMIGGGGSTYGFYNYFFVDSTYPLILVRYGAVLLVAVGVCWTALTLKLCWGGHRVIAYAMTIVAVHSLSEYHFLDINYNIFLLLPFAAYRVKRVRRVKRSTVYSAGLAVATVAVLLLCLLPRVMTVLRTVTTLEVWRSGHVPGIVLFLGYTGLFLLFVGIGYGWYRIYSRLLWRRRIRFASTVSLLVCCVIGMFGYVYCSLLVDAQSANYAEQIEDEREALELALAASQGGVYVERIPAVYQAYFPQIKDTILPTDELGRKYNATILTTRNRESVPLIEHGFLYIPITGSGAIYTNDEAVVRAFEAADYRVTGYYPEERYVDLAWAAQLSGLTLDENGFLNLRGGEWKLDKGPWVSSYKGEYTAYFRMYTSEPSTNEDYLICRLFVNGQPSYLSFARYPVYRGQFDENGYAVIEAPYWQWEGTHSMEWQVIPAENRFLQVIDIRYKRTPPYDVHSFYDRTRKVCKKEYFDLEGNCKEMEGGYTTAMYVYDDKGNILDTQYFDVNGNEIWIE